MMPEVNDYSCRSVILWALVSILTLTAWSQNSHSDGTTTGDSPWSVPTAPSLVARFASTISFSSG
jgi:hypothetical protein